MNHPLTLSDRPRPGPGYLALLVLLLCGPLALLIGAAVVSATRAGSPSVAVWAVLLVTVLAAALVALVFHAAYATRYVLDEGRLRLRSGVIIHASIALDDIDRVEAANFIPRVLGWGGGYGLANRMTNGLRIVTRSKGAHYYMSPTDPEAFRAAIEAQCDARRAR